MNSIAVQRGRYADQTRLVFDLRPAGIPEVLALGWYRHARAQEGLKMHHHPGAMEICYLARGRQLYTTGKQRYLLRGGDLFITRPDEPHSSGEEPQEKGILYWMILAQPRPGRPFLGCRAGEAGELFERLNALPTHFHHGPRLQPHFDALLRSCEAISSGSITPPLSRPLLVNGLMSLLFALILEHRKESAPSPLIAHLLRYIDEQITEPLPLDLLADQTGLSLSRFKVRFKQEVGMPPAEYLLRRKIAKAQEWLEQDDGRSITEIAFALGFSSSQYFATAFRRYAGCSPSELTRRHSAP